MQHELLFKVISGQREHKIYTDGHIEGFAEGAIVINCFDSLVAKAIHDFAHPRRTRTADFLSSDTAEPHREQRRIVGEEARRDATHQD